MEQIEHQTPPEKQQTSPETKNYEQSHGTPHLQKRDMK